MLSRGRAPSRKTGWIVVVLILAAIFILIETSQRGGGNVSDGEDAAWSSIGTRIVVEVRQFQNAHEVNNLSDMQSALKSIQGDCHEAEPLQYHPGKMAGPKEQAVKDLCASAGFALPALP